MQYVCLGKSGLKVSRVILGCMSYGSSQWQNWVLDEKEGIEHIKAAYDLGINAFDTANTYSSGLSEVVLGKAIKQHSLPRDEIVVMTKVYGGFVPNDFSNPWISMSPAEERDKIRLVNQYGLGRKSIFQSVKNSLTRLQLDYIDVLLCHRFDYDTQIEETMQALHDVVQAGLVRYIGMSSCYAWQFHKMQNYAITHKLTPFIVMQNHHSAVYREEEREMAPLLQDFAVGMTPWSPLARGFLTRPRAELAQTTRSQSDGGLTVSVSRVATIAQRHGVTMAQVALAWSLSKP
ncbi:hypothetical protein M407DRAFT_229219 [Tulasnella calospora MUT 4182]|uniref:NADP-dependent oxidoreductase domain-containing protein n=1 Tax=Tulasnella calospora MUT 4182 TaxID=1051891 RepID=A0A0C3QMA1_9AGAM|nr:hypothetical protein M407DRAFT_229219 [Tulasnella calospora MUT 4182]